MKIIYRISPFTPDNPAVVYPKDKWKLVMYSHTSFLGAGGGEYDTTYILDSCEEWGTYFKDFGIVMDITSKSKNTSLLIAYDVALNGNADTLFVEDDYLWRPDTIPVLEKALPILKVLSPYDHPAHYLEERFDKKYETKLIDNHVYRTCPSNTHTFAVTKEVLKDNIMMLKDYGVRDHDMFTELNKTAQLWCPSYSFATHLAKDCIAPNVDWNIPLS